MGNTLGNEITEALRDAIIAGEIKQGSKLSEIQLAKEYGVSRGPLREAIRRLEGMNLVQHIPQQGVRVVVLKTETLMHLYQAREALESKATALAAVNMTSLELDALNRQLDSQARLLKDSRSAVVPAEMDYQFHQSIILASRNPFLIHQLNEEIYFLIKMFSYQDINIDISTTNALFEHKQIVYAIEQKKPEFAEAVARQHIIHERTNILQHLKSRF